ncbi:hypothetical protein ACFOLA_13405 [Salinicoccus hispanicus]|uniref:hypothetical protein n=1 Tax=Salinicoccus hispanicus TaxID=157225 RepID=UPI00360CD693
MAYRWLMISPVLLNPLTNREIIMRPNRMVDAVGRHSSGRYWPKYVPMPNITQ